MNYTQKILAKKLGCTVQTLDSKICRFGHIEKALGKKREKIYKGVRQLDIIELQDLIKTAKKHTRWSKNKYEN